MTSEHSFLFFLKEGKIEFTNSGNIIFFNEGSIIIPVRVFNKMLLTLKEKVNVESFFEELARFQVENALKRYKKIIGIDNVPKEKIFELALKIMETLGIGKPTVEKFSEEEIILKFPHTIFSYEYVLEYGKCEKPFDIYFKYLMKAGMEIIFGGKYKVEEVKCYAKGDSECLFVAKKL